MYKEWENKKDQFKVIDLRQAKGNCKRIINRCIEKTMDL